jgi:hypothetical protein
VYLVVIPPKILKPLRRQLGVFHRVLNVPMSQVELDRARILVRIGQLIPTPVPELVWMHREAQLGDLTGVGDHLPDTGIRQRPLALGEKDVRGRACQPFEFPERTNLDAGQRVCAGHTVLDAPHMKEALLEVELIPAQGDQFLIIP